MKAEGEVVGNVKCFIRPECALQSSMGSEQERRVVLADGYAIGNSKELGEQHTAN